METEKLTYLFIGSTPETNVIVGACRQSITPHGRA
jgi:hypothetical protein